MELLRPANSTVTVFRSPACAPGEVRIFSARCLGVYAWGAGIRSADCTPSSLAHCPQNRLSGGLDAPHFGQTAASGIAHSPQNREPAGLSWSHRGHFIGGDLNLESLVGCGGGRARTPGRPPPPPPRTTPH